MANTHGQYCDICNKFIKKGKIDAHFAKHDKQAEKLIKKLNKKKYGRTYS